MAFLQFHFYAFSIKKIIEIGKFLNKFSNIILFNNYFFILIQQYAIIIKTYYIKFTKFNFKRKIENILFTILRTL